jgi:hypothetical protein
MFIGSLPLSFGVAVLLISVATFKRRPKRAELRRASLFLMSRWHDFGLIETRSGKVTGSIPGQYLFYQGSLVRCSIRDYESIGQKSLSNLSVRFGSTGERM